MSDRLTALRTERDMIESRDDWANPALGYLNDTIEALEAEEKAKAPEPTTTEPAGDPLAALASEMEAALANPGRLSDAERDALVRCYNTAAIDAGTTSTGRVDQHRAGRRAGSRPRHGGRGVRSRRAQP